EESIWSEDEPVRKHKRFELTEERIERIMGRLEEADPEKAEKLAELREEDPEKFKDELRELMRERFGRRMREGHKEGRKEARRPGGGPSGKHGRPPGFGPPGYGPSGIGPPGYWTPGRMEWLHREYLEWLEENRPDEAKNLAELKEENPELYERQFRLSMKKYGRIAKVAKDNPELAAVLKEDLELKEQRAELLEEIESASDEEKEALTEELKEVVSRRFDLIVKRKELEYEQLRKKVAELQERVDKSEAKMETWREAEFKSESIESRVKELLGNSDEFKW
ncbi:MAG: hypothetical protein ACYSR5_08810, partial [Planctomycetota bacterium]